MAEMEGSDVKLISSGPLFEIWRGSKGIMRLDWTKKGVVRLIVDGHGHAGFAAPAVRRFEDASRGQRITVVADFRKMISYESPFRQGMQEWGAKHRKDMETLIVGSTSKLVSMGASVAQLAMGVTMRAHTRNEDFDRECHKLGLALNPPMGA